MTNNTRYRPQIQNQYLNDICVLVFILALNTTANIERKAINI